MTDWNAMTVEQLAAEVDRMSVERLSAALAALKDYEAETGDWISERQADAEDNGEELVEDDAYYADYDEFCEQLGSELVAEHKTSAEEMALMMTILCGEWPKIVGAMKDSAKGDLVIDVCNRV